MYLNKIHVNYLGLNIVVSFLLLLLLGRFSRVRLCATPQTAAHQDPPSLGFSRQEHWRGLPLPSPWDPAPTISYVPALELSPLFL